MGRVSERSRKIMNQSWRGFSMRADHELKRKEFVDTLKRQLCQHIRRMAIRQGLTQRGLALVLETSESRISKVTRMHIDELTIDSLFNYLLILEPRTKVLVAI